MASNFHSMHWQVANMQCWLCINPRSCSCSCSWPGGENPGVYRGDIYMYIWPKLTTKIYVQSATDVGKKSAFCLIVCSPAMQAKGK